MGNSTALAFMEEKLFPCSLRLKVGLILLAIFAGLTSEEETGLLCISDCTTCPIICSPPPPQPESSNPPPSPDSPPPPVHHSPAPQYYYTSPPPSPPSPSPPKKSPSPPSSSSTYSSKGSPPAPWNYFYNLPPSGPDQVPPTTGVLQHNNSFPYYYFYASEASSLSVHAFFLAIILVQIVFSFW